MEMNGGRLWKWVTVPYDVSWTLARILMSLTYPNCPDQENQADPSVI